MGIKIRNVYTPKRGVIVETDNKSGVEEMINSANLQNVNLKVKLKPERRQE